MLPGQHNDKTLSLYQERSFSNITGVPYMHISQDPHHSSISQPERLGMIPLNEIEFGVRMFLNEMK